MYTKDMEFPVHVFLATTIIYILMICAHSLEWKTPQGSCTVTICSGKDAVLQNLKYTINPDPPKMEQNVTITLDGDLTKEVTKGSKISGGYTLDGVTKRMKTGDFCDVITRVNHTCPLQPGPFHLAVVLYIPYLAPGNYGAFTNSTDQDGDPLFCLRANCWVLQNN